MFLSCPVVGSLSWAGRRRGTRCTAPATRRGTPTTRNLVKNKYTGNNNREISIIKIIYFI